jgi:hypothetical protein
MRGEPDQRCFPLLFSLIIVSCRLAFFKRLDREQPDQEFKRTDYERSDQTKLGRRFTYRPSQIRWREVWMPFAASVLPGPRFGTCGVQNRDASWNRCRTNNFRNPPWSPKVLSRNNPAMPAMGGRN